MTENEALRIVANPHLKWKCHEVDSALTMIRNALEKQVPKKPLLVPMDDTCLYYEKHCPNCESLLVVRYKHCPKCGQKFDWGE